MRLVKLGMHTRSMTPGSPAFNRVKPEPHHRPPQIHIKPGHAPGFSFEPADAKAP